ncbi:MAG TPA: MFS transporter [Candidatus Thermoplasmatota archaeon]|nr:MFS transporter [Candidatus Thermoplasmatota archaeon]
MAATGDIATDRATRREWIGLGVLSLTSLVVVMDLSVLHLAVPSLTRALAPSPAELLWIVDIYGFLVAGALITMGTLGDRIGRRRLLRIGAVAFALASAIAAFSSSSAMLIASRALMGLAGATLAPSTLALLRNMFRERGDLTTAIAIWSTSFAVGGILGPIVGGLLLERFWWGSVFLINVPIMAALFLLAPRLLPEFRHPSAERLDLASAALSLAGVLGVIYGVKRLAEGDAGTASAVAVVIGLALLGAFVLRQRRLEHPFIDLRLLRSTRFATLLVAFMFSATVMFSISFFGAQFLQLDLGFSPQEAGLWSVPGAAAIVVSGLLSPALGRRFDHARLIAAGYASAGVGLALFVQASLASDLALYVAAWVLVGLALGPVFTFSTELILRQAAPERAGSAAAVSETSAELGGALGIAVLGSLGVAIYRLSLAATAPPGLGAEDARAAAESLARAREIARGLPADLGEPLLAAARAAFGEAFATVAVVTAIAMLGTSIAVAVVFGRDLDRQA